MNMDAKHPFDIENYLSVLCASNKLAQAEHFYFCTCSGLEGLQGPIEAMTRENAFLCLDDTSDGSVFRGGGGGWFTKRTITVFLIRRYRHGDMTDRAENLGICRALFRQLMSRFIVDQRDLSNELVFLHTENVMCREFGVDLLDSCTGLYFMLEISEPTLLKFDKDEWLK